MDFSSLGFDINLPEFTTIFDKGIASGIGWLLSFAFMGLLAIWIVFSIIAAYKITTSGMEKAMEEGFTLIKNVWISATVGLAFFAVLSVIGSFIGVGNFTEWNYTLSQCHDNTGGFYFMDISAQEQFGITGSNVQCCYIDNVSSMADEYVEANFKSGTYHYIIDPGAGTSQCENF